METRVKELVAIGASVSARCAPCLKYHFERSTELGIYPEEISIAIGIGRAVGKGAGQKIDETASALTGVTGDESGNASGECGCRCE